MRRRRGSAPAIRMHLEELVDALTEAHAAAGAVRDLASTYELPAPVVDAVTRFALMTSRVGTALATVRSDIQALVGGR
jgi:hypothetical protein